MSSRIVVTAGHVSITLQVRAGRIKNKAVGLFWPGLEFATCSRQQTQIKHSPVSGKHEPSKVDQVKTLDNQLTETIL